MLLQAVQLDSQKLLGCVRAFSVDEAQGLGGLPHMAHKMLVLQVQAGKS